MRLWRKRVACPSRCPTAPTPLPEPFRIPKYSHNIYQPTSSTMPPHDASKYYGPPVDTIVPPMDYSEPFSPPFTNCSPSPPVPTLQPGLFAPPPITPSETNGRIRRSRSQEGFQMASGFNTSPKETLPARRTPQSGRSPFRRPEMKERLSPPTPFQIPSRSGAASHPPTDSAAVKHTPGLALRTGSHTLNKSRSAVWSKFEEQLQLHESPAAQEEESQSQIMIGIDFGTTYARIGS